MKEIEILHDNIVLKAVWHQANSNKKNITVVMCHGFRGSKDGGGKAVNLAEKIAGRFNVLRFDFIPLSTLSSQVSQLNSVLQYCKKHNSGKVILLGRSMGGATSLIAANGCNDLVGIILWATPIDVIDTFTNAFGKENMLLVQKNETVQLDDEWGKTILEPVFYQDLLKYDLRKCVENLSVIPKLFVHGECDEVVALEQGQQAFALAKEPKEFCLIKNGDHRFTIGSQEAIKAVDDWLSKYF